jgi:hypothetical protein
MPEGRKMNTSIKPDLYTKVILTVIAVCLVCLCVNTIAFTTPAYARDEAIDPNNVSLSDWAQRDAPAPPQVMAVKIVGYEMPGALPVQMAKAPKTPVNIVGVNVPSAWMPNTLPVVFPSDTNFPRTYRRTPYHR